jgi:tRNA A-37 threonylcarbamoyl transferase component Bud32
MSATDAAVVWHLPAELRRRLIGPAGCLRLEEWLRDGRATVLKAGRHRSVWRVRLGRLDFVLKEYRAAGLRGRLREMARPVKARSEFDRAAALARRGVAVPRPLGWGVLGPPGLPRASFLITATVPDARPLGEVTAACTTAVPRQCLARDLGRFVAGLHAAGVTHHDFHPGNVLVGAAGLVLIDLHGTHVGRPLGWARRRDNLAMFNRYFALRAQRTDRLRFWHAYRGAAGPLPDRPDATPQVVEERTLDSNRALWRARSKKCLEDGRTVRPIGGPAAHGWAVKDLPAELVEVLVHEPAACLMVAGAKRVKDGGASTVVVAPPVVIKRFNRRSWLDGVKNLVRRSPALRSWLAGHALADAGLPTPRPLALVQGRRGPLESEGYLLTEYLPDTLDLREFADGLVGLPADKRRSAVRERLTSVARVVRQFHERHFAHRDLKAGNLLTPADPRDHRVWFIDLVGVYRRRRASRAARVRDLGRLAASFLSHPGLTRGDRLRFLLAYLDAGTRGAWGWRRWWRELAAAAQAKQARNARLGRVLG